MHRRLHVPALIGVALLLSLLGTPSHARPPNPANVLDAARGAVRRGDSEAAGRFLMDVLIDLNVDDLTFLEVAYLAQEAEDGTAVSEVRTQAAKRLETESAERLPAALHAAMGYACLGKAIDYWRRKTMGSSIPLLFDEAEQHAKSARESAWLRAEPTPFGAPFCADMAALLEARVQGAQGLYDAAIEALVTRRLEKTPEPGDWRPLLVLTEARARYERGAARPLDSAGRPDEATQNDLTEAAHLFHTQAGAAKKLFISARKRDELAARVAWTHHRLGNVQSAAQAYDQLFHRGPKSARLALRGLESLYANDPARLDRTLESLARSAHGAGAPAWTALAELRLKRGETERAHEAARSAVALGAHFAASCVLAGRTADAAGKPEEAVQHLERALAVNPEAPGAVAAFDGMARRAFAEDPQGAVVLYERLLRAVPDNPHLHNNLGFVLREMVTPYTDIDAHRNQRLKADAPPEARELLARCVRTYERAVALIDELQDGARDLEEDWRLAGIVNDYALMLHYFEDVRDAAKAESLYHRALRMSDQGYCDTYVPNLQLLYTHVLKDRPLAWYRVAKEAQEGILAEGKADDGSFDLVADESKRALAAQDVERLRAAVLKELGVTPPKRDEKAAPGGEGATER